MFSLKYGKRNLLIINIFNNLKSQICVPQICLLKCMQPIKHCVFSSVCCISLHVSFFLSYLKSVNSYLLSFEKCDERLKGFHFGPLCWSKHREECCWAESSPSACVREHGVRLTLGLPLSSLSAPHKCAQEWHSPVFWICGCHVSLEWESLHSDTRCKAWESLTSNSIWNETFGSMRIWIQEVGAFTQMGNEVSLNLG